MNIIDCSPAPAAQDSLSSAKNKIVSFIEDTFSSTSTQKAVEKAAQACAKIFNSKYTLLKNVPVEGMEASIPLILIGPPGIYILAVSGIKGVFRARDESWLELKGQTRQFQPARPNLVQRAVLMKQAVEDLLTQNGFAQAEVNTLLVFTNPGVHIDTVRPAVRLILADGLEIYLNSLLQKTPVYRREDIRKISALFKDPHEADRQPSIRDQFDFNDEPKKKPVRKISLGAGLPAPDAVITKNLVSAANKVHMTTGQWVFIGFLLVFQIALLIGIILMITSSF
jgi:predicted XRE-type DNA-binding protein